MLFSMSFINLYSKESTKAVQLASITSFETPTVLQLSLPSVDSINTLTFDPVALLESKTLTL